MSMPMLLLFASFALAAEPRVAWTSAEGTGVVALAVAGKADRYVGFVESGTGGVRVLDTATWDITVLAPCSGGRATAVGASDTVSERLFVGCGNGTLTWVSLSGDLPALSGVTLSGSTDPIRGVAAVEGVLVALAGPLDGGTYQLLSASTPATLSSGDSLVAGVSFTGVGFEDLGVSGSWAVVSQGQSFAGRVAPVGGGYVPNNSAVGANDLTDVLDTSGPGGDVNALIADPTNGVMSFNLNTLDVLPVLASTNGVESPTALALFDGQLLVADADRDAFLTFPYNNSTGLPGTAEQDAAAFPGSGGAVLELVTTGAYAVAGTSGGEVWVYTDRPWVELTTDAAGAVTEGESVALTFRADTDGDWAVVLNPTDGDAGGATLASGTLSADTDTEATITVDGTWVEGANQLRLLVSDGDGLDGHDAVLVSIDSPPDAVVLRPSNVGFGDSKLTLSFDGVDDADLDGYDVYVSTTPFTAADFNGCDEAPCGGPAWNGESNLNTPIFESADPGESVEVTISPLDNNQTHYLAVRATDQGGQEGSMSNVVSGTPRKTYSAAELAGDPGGFGCATGGPGGRALGILGLLGAVAVCGRRRAVAMASILLPFGLIAGGPAQAAPDVPDPLPRVEPLRDLQGEGLDRGVMALRVGPMSFDDKDLKGVYGDRGLTMAWLEGGPRFSRFLALTGGVGFLQKRAKLVDADYIAATDENVLQAIPLSVNGVFRLDVFREQPLVPYVTAGGDYWLWRERWDVDREEGTTDQLGGGKLGYHWAVGGEILLDIFDRERASRIEARRGVDDSYLTVEYRQQQVGDGGLSFSGSSVSVGLSLAY